MDAQRTCGHDELAAAEHIPCGGSSGEVAGCLCASTAVAWWSGRETLALRQALRMNLRVFAEHLGVGVTTVCRWEDRRIPASPNTAMQSLLDQALKLADPDARARFWLILRGGAIEADKTAPDQAGTVTVLRTATTAHDSRSRHRTAELRGHAGSHAPHGPGQITQERPA